MRLIQYLNEVTAEDALHKITKEKTLEFGKMLVTLSKEDLTMARNVIVNVITHDENLFSINKGGAVSLETWKLDYSQLSDHTEFNILVSSIVKRVRKHNKKTCPDVKNGDGNYWRTDEFKKDICSTLLYSVMTPTTKKKIVQMFKDNQLEKAGQFLDTIKKALDEWRVSGITDKEIKQVLKLHKILDL